MNQNVRTAVIAAVFIVLGFGVWYLFRESSPTEESPAANKSAASATRTSRNGADDESASANASSTSATPSKPEVIARSSGGEGPRKAGAGPKERGDGAVFGIVLNPDNQPVPQITVTLEKFEYDKPFQPPSAADRSTAQSDANGRFEFDHLPMGMWQYFLTASTEDSAGAQFAWIARERPRADITLKLEHAAALAGHVFDTDEKPVDKALLVPFEQEGQDRNRRYTFSSGARVETDATGAFAFSALPKGRWKIMVRAEGHATLISDYVSTGATDARLVLKAGGSVSGKVLDAQTREPKAGVTVQVNPKDYITDFQKATSDAQGSFNFPALRPADYRVSLDDPLLVVAGESPKITVAEGRPVTGIEVRVASGSVITGRVYDSDTKRGIQGVKLMAYCQSQGFYPRKSEPTDADGAYRLAGLSEAVYNIQIQDAPGYGRNGNGIIVSVPLGKEIPNVDIPLKGGVSVRGRVIDTQKQPVAKAQVSGMSESGWGGGSSSTDENGQFEVKGFSLASPVRLWAEYQDLVSKQVGPLTLTENGLDNVELVLDQERNGSISGIVVDPDNKPVPKVRLYAYDQANRRPMSNEAFADDQGKFVFTRLTPGSYRINISSPSGYSSNSESPENIEVASGAQVTGVRLVYTGNTGLSITGTVTDPKGAPVQNAQINAQGPSYAYVGTDPSGAYTLTGLKEGEYTVNVQHGEFSRQSRSANAGDTKVDFQLQERGSVEGQVLDARTGAPVAAFEIQALQGNQSAMQPYMNQSFIRVYDSTGHFRLPNVESGDTSLAVRGEGYSQVVQSIGQVGPGQTLGNVVIRLQPGAGVQGVVLSPTRQPVSGALIYLGELPQRWERERSSIAQSAADGSFTVNNASGASVTLTAYHPQYAPATVTANLASSGTTRVEIVLNQGGSITGRVTTGSGGAGHTWISLQVAGRQTQESTQVKPDGTYEFQNVLPGDVTVVAGFSINNTSSRQLQRAVTVTAGQNVVVDFNFPPYSTALSGIVTVQGKPAVSGFIQATVTTSSGDESSHAQIQSDGSYRFDALPQGTATLTGSASDGERQGRINIEVVIPSGGAVRQDIVTTLPARIHGTVTGATGGYSGVAVLQGEVAIPATVTPELYAHYQEIDVASMTLAPDGAYNLDGVPPGVYTVVAYSAPSQSAEALPQLRHASSVVNLTEGADIVLDFSLR
ncbi:MAG: carboxypeptidase regulatory-like domain-containing protein [Candidatus Hydrogenedentes bacterium]|nr:carboxypeptidase regulatory-like domain-containing protein [Candidatus Hydrogenedentota bacterium]